MTDRIDVRGSALELRLGAGPAAEAYAELSKRALEERWAERVHDRDATLWSDDPRVQAAIGDRLGWLDAPQHFSLLVPSIEGFANARREEGFTAAVVAGMGGSSLAPDMLNRMFGSGEGWLTLRVLDSTDPEAVAAAVDDLDPLATLFIVATKSGTTTEPLAFLADAWARIHEALQARHEREKPGDIVVAVTDPGKSVEAIPHHDEFRELFLNPPDIGGRYSALTYVGLLPATLIGLDIDPFLASAQAMVGQTRDNDPTRNPALALGLALGALATNGRDKLTFVPDPSIAAFGGWTEQLIAESTGKHGVGIVPVDLEPLGAPEAYGSDRVFVRIALTGSDAPLAPDGRSADALLEDLAAAGHPVIRIEVPGGVDIAAEFVRWEFATAIAGVVLDIDPFDQPNVEEAKENTRKLLEHHDASASEVQQNDLGGAFQGGMEPAITAPSSVAMLAESGPITLIGDTPLQLTHAEGTAVDEMRRHLARLKPLGYAALQAYIAPTAARDVALARIRTLLRDSTRRATTLGYGPRFLHSTGQLHKGGAPIGWFLQLTADHPRDRQIPGWPYTFGELIDAQALGDFQTLEAHDLPVLRVHLGPDPDRGLAALEALLTEALKEGVAMTAAQGGTA